MIVVLNKVDLLPEEGRAKKIETATQRIRKSLATTRFSCAPIVVLAAAPGGSGKLGAAAPLADPRAQCLAPLKMQSDSVTELVSVMQSTVSAPERRSDGPFVFAVDHCFPIKGQGTVLTGTVLNGRCRLGDAD